MRIASLTLWQTRFSRKSHHVRKNLFSKNIYSYNYFISSHFFLQMQTRISKAFLFNHCQKPRIFNCYYNYGFYFRLINKYCNGVKVLSFIFIYEHMPFHEIFNIHELFIHYTNLLYGAKLSSIYSCFIRLLFLLHSGLNLDCLPILNFDFNFNFEAKIYTFLTFI